MSILVSPLLGSMQKSIHYAEASLVGAVLKSQANAMIGKKGFLKLTGWLRYFPGKDIAVSQARRFAKRDNY